MLLCMATETSPHPSLDRRRLRTAREDRGLTREELAVAAGIAVRTLAGIELGESEPRRSTVAVLATALGVDIDVLRPHPLAIDRVPAGVS